MVFTNGLWDEPSPAEYTSSNLQTSLQTAFKNALNSYPTDNSTSFINYILTIYIQSNLLGVSAT